MHVPDGFIDAPVSVAAGAVAAAGVAVCLRGARRELDDRTAPLAGLVAAFIFAVQMLNFPVAAGTSGHLLGGALAAILVGPYTGVLCVAVVLLVQGVLFADGGLTALGVNITLHGARHRRRRLRASSAPWSGAAANRRRTVTVAAVRRRAGLGAGRGPGLHRALRDRRAPRTSRSARSPPPWSGVHVLIGIGEAPITALTVGTVLAVRPDLVYGARGLAAPLAAARRRRHRRRRARPDGPAPAAAPPAAPAGSCRAGIVGGAALLAGVVSFYASASPDGLEKVAADKGIDQKTEDHAAEDSPLADYGVKDIANARLSGGLAGVIGVGVTLAVGSGVFVVVRRGAGPTPTPRRGSRWARATRTGSTGAGTSPVHRLPPHCKLAAVFCFVLVVVATPARGVLGVRSVRPAAGRRGGDGPHPGRVPAAADADRDPVRGVRGADAVRRGAASGSRSSGCRSASPGCGPPGTSWPRARSGVAASVMLAATTELRAAAAGAPAAADAAAAGADRVVHDPLRGRHHRRDAPDADRPRVARFRGARRAALRVLAKSAGALFIRSYERGERVHLAMLSRGYTGTMPVIHEATASRAQWPSPPHFRWPRSRSA